MYTTFCLGHAANGQFHSVATRPRLYILVKLLLPSYNFCSNSLGSSNVSLRKICILNGTSTGA